MNDLHLVLIAALIVVCIVGAVRLIEPPAPALRYSQQVEARK